MGTIIFNVLLLRGSLVLPLRAASFLVCKMGFREPGAGWILLERKKKSVFRQ